MIPHNLGPDAPIETLPNGAKQSASPYRADLLPPLALLHVAEILSKGAVKYGEQNWRGLTIAHNVNHAMVHLLAHQAGDISDDHLGHATCRMLMALELSKVPVQNDLDNVIDTAKTKALIVARICPSCSLDLMDDGTKDTLYCNRCDCSWARRSFVTTAP